MEFSSFPSGNHSTYSPGAHGQYSHIGDNYTTLEQVKDALQRGGLESCNLIVGIDFTKSNEWSGKHTFGGRFLHAVDPTGVIENPYEEAVAIIGKTLSYLDEDQLIPCFGFGDVTTHDEDVFSFFPDNRPCNGFGEALARYRAIVPHVRLSGPTSFAPIIEMAMKITAESGQYHILVIIADGQVTSCIGSLSGEVSPQEQATKDAIIAASFLPLSIILVGVGDGPWDQMEVYDNVVQQRNFDNFQFVNFSEIMANSLPQEREVQFALNALMEIPAQCAATAHMLGRRLTSNLVNREPKTTPAAVPSGSAVEDCPVCWAERRDVAFNCGHQTCQSCADSLQICPLCREEITQKILLYT